MPVDRRPGQVRCPKCGEWIDADPGKVHPEASGRACIRGGAVTTEQLLAGRCAVCGESNVQVLELDRHTQQVIPRCRPCHDRYGRQEGKALLPDAAGAVKALPESQKPRRSWHPAVRPEESR